MQRIIIVLVLLVFAVGPVAVAQEEASPTPSPFPRVRNRVLRNTAEQLHARLVDINQHRLDAYERVLERLEAVLGRITDIADRRAARGADASQVYEGITAAQKAIDTARSAVREQASRVYLIDGSTDRTVGDRLRAMRGQMAIDLRSVAGEVRSALGEVRNVARLLRTLSTSE